MSPIIGAVLGVLNLSISVYYYSDNVAYKCLLCFIDKLYTVADERNGNITEPSRTNVTSTLWKCSGCLDRSYRIIIHQFILFVLLYYVLNKLIR